MTTTFNPTSQRQLDAAADQRRQALLITGNAGSGVLGAATYFARQLGATPVDVRPVDRKTGNIDMENGKILVPLIRNLYESTRGKATNPHVVIIHAADRMTHSAQSAFLKLLEEPRENLHFILISESTGRLLPTILSRVSSIHLRPITTTQTELLLDELECSDIKKRQQIAFIAGGLPEKIDKLATDEEYFAKQASAMATAKQLLSDNLYDRVVLIGTYKDDRRGALELIEKLLLITHRMLKSQPTEQLVGQLTRLLAAKEHLEYHGNVRLSLLRSVLQ